MGILKFNGISTEDLGLVIQTPPSHIFPDRDMSSVHVPGRNGDLFIDNKCYNMVERGYSLAKAFTVKNTGHYANTQQILAWLTSANGRYVRLEDTYDSEVYRMAMFNMSGSFVDLYNEATTVEVSFKCKPQRYLKSGEIPLNHVGNVYTVENNYQYEALPTIQISNIPISEYLDEYIMLTVRNNEDELVSSITISNISQNDIIKLDSENQDATKVTSNGEIGISEKVGLNGMKFPLLGPGKTKFELKRYKSINSNIINSYDTIMSKRLVKCSCLYKTTEKQADEKQNKVFIRSWNDIIEKNSKYFYAIAYSEYLNQLALKSVIFDNSDPNNPRIADNVSFNSFNDAIAVGVKATQKIKGNLSDLSIKDESYEFVKITQNNNKYEIYAKQDGYFLIITASIKKQVLHFYNASETTPIASDIPDTDVTEIRWYQADINGSTHKLHLGYENIPNWIIVDVLYEDNTNNVPIGARYKTAKAGYFFMEGSGFFAKDKWMYLSSGVVLNGMDWNTSKGEFQTTEGIIKKSDKTYNFKYVDADYNTLPTYQNDDEDSKSFVSFKVEDDPTNKTLSTLKLYPLIKGFFKVIISGDDEVNWSDIRDPSDSGHIIPTSKELKGSQSFEVHFIYPDESDHPKVSYIDEENFPDWLDPYPYKDDDSTHDKVYLNAKNITFKVLENSNYRFSIPKDNDEYEWSSWTNISANQFINFGTGSKKTVNDSFYLAEIETIPTSYPGDRCFNYIHSGQTEPSDDVNPPSWLDFKIVIKLDKDSELPTIGAPNVIYLVKNNNKYDQYEWTGTDYQPVTPATETKDVMTIVSNQKGFFKWAQNTNWLYRDPNNLEKKGLTEIGVMDEIDIYYVIDNAPDSSDLSEKLPKYERSDFPDATKPQSFFDKLDIIVKASADGNPEEVTYTIKKTENSSNAGYYKFNNESDWKWYNEGDTLFFSRTSETNDIYYLVEDTSPEVIQGLSNINITIIPRWWML